MNAVPMFSEADRIDSHASKDRVQAPQSSLPMLKIRHLLLCTDFSAAAHGAFDAAVHLCEYTKSKVTVLHVCELGPMPATTDVGIAYTERLYAEREKKLREVVKELQALGVEARSLSLDGNAPSIILEQIERVGFDLVVIGTRATLGMERLIFGSTAEAVFRRASCPVMTVGRQGCFSVPPDVFAPIVFATDFHESHEQSVKYAAGLANRLGTVLHCVHVLPLSDKDKRDAIPEGIMKEALSRLTHQGGLCQMPPMCDVLYGSDVSHAIVDYATAQKAQLIVLGVRRKTRVAAHLPPQRTYRIIMTAPCPVLTLSTERDGALSIAAGCL